MSRPLESDDRRHIYVGDNMGSTKCTKEVKETDGDVCPISISIYICTNCYSPHVAELFISSNILCSAGTFPSPILSNLPFGFFYFFFGCIVFEKNIMKVVMEI